MAERKWRTLKRGSGESTDDERGFLALNGLPHYSANESYDSFFSIEIEHFFRLEEQATEMARGAEWQESGR